MWRRTYLFLVLVRLWFALSPSYLHPDENFQGPEVIAGMCPGPVLECRTTLGVPGVAQRSPLHISRGHGADCAVLQGKSSATQSGTLGNLRATARYEAYSHYGPFTGCRCSCCGGYG